MPSATGYSFSYNGADFGDSAYNLYLLESAKEYFPGGEIPSMSIPYKDSQSFFNRYHSPRILSLSCVIEGTSFANVKSKLDSLKFALNEREPRALILGYQPDRYYLATPVGPFVGDIKNYYAKLTLNFVCHDPIAKSVTLTEDTKSDFTNAVAFDVPTGGGVLAGTHTVDPVVYVRPAYGSGNITAQIKVKLLPDGREVTQDADFTVGIDNWFKVDFALKTWQIGTGSGSGVTLPTTWTNAMTSMGGQFATFSPGVVNTATITVGAIGPTNNKAIFQYRAAYV